MNNKLIITILILLIFIYGAIVYLGRDTSKTQTQTNQQTAAQQQTIEEYIRENISNLSPEKEVLGGTFYTTNIEAHGGAGTVSYEDGHNAFVADFTYTVDESGRPSVTSFTVRK